MSMDLALGSGSRISGPTYLNRSCMMMKMNNNMGGETSYNVAAGYGGDVGVGQPVDAKRKLMQQPFVMSNTSSSTCGSVFKSPGGIASMGFFPFTNAQWKELERQAMVFKYMMHSIPVPYELLFPFITATNPSGMGRDAHLLKFMKNGDPEPGRCRRTDGKKWRCSNAVALDQKYCEKHVHRGRPRSRKHVEAASEINMTNKKPSLPHENQTNAVAASAFSVSKPVAETQNGAILNLNKFSKSTTGYSNAAFQLPLGNEASDASLFPPSHPSDLFGGLWPQLMQFKTGHAPNPTTYSNTLSEHHQPSTLNSYAQFDAQLKPEFNLKRPASDLIDAWTVNCNTSNNDSHDYVSLGLSMGHGYDEYFESQNKPPHISNWLNQSGGPLGEVLRPTGTNPTSSPTTAAGVEDSCNNNNSSQVSSSLASGVLQKAVASLSDSTRHPNSDTTTLPSQSKSVFQWLNQDGLLKLSS